MLNTMKKTVLATVILLAPAFTSAEEINVGGKNFTEQLLLAEMTTQLLQANGFTVKKSDGMGSTVVRTAQENGQIDVYWEYTGTSLITYNKVKERLTASATYDTVKKLDAAKGLVWLNPSQADNTYALAMRKEDAAAKKITKLSQLASRYARGDGLKMGVDAEFSKREDGLPGLQKAYGFKVARSELSSMQSGLIYQALKGGQVDVGLVFATDGRIAAFDFLVLEDDEGFFPAYALAPVVRKRTLDANPKIGELLNELSARLDDTTMQALNARVDVDKEAIAAVAASFLKKHGLL